MDMQKSRITGSSVVRIVKVRRVICLQYTLACNSDASVACTLGTPKFMCVHVHVLLCIATSQVLWSRLQDEAVCSEYFATGTTSKVKKRMDVTSTCYLIIQIGC